DFLRTRNLTITVFIVGQDAALDKNRELLRAIAAAGHEIGNHSFHHEPWLHLYSEERTDTELGRAEEHIERATGQRPLGFRGPGFSLSPATLRILARRGYRYDASTLPTFLGPVARAYYFMRTRLTPEQREQRKLLFGTFAEGWQPLRPYRWRTDAGELLEIPVTTMPIFRTPFHVSYLLYLSAVAPRLAVGYFRAILALCRWTGTEPSLLLHAVGLLARHHRLTSRSPMKSELVSLIVKAVREVGELGSAPLPPTMDGETPLFGREGFLDSLGLVTLMVAVEQAIEDELGVSVSL